MQFNHILLSAAAFTLALAQPQLTNVAFAPVAGQAFDITWQGATGPVQLILKNGASTNLQTVGTIASGLTGTAFAWTPPTSLDPNQEYAIEIVDSSNVPNYSTQFQVTGSSGVTSSAEASSAVASTSSALATSSVVLSSALSAEASTTDSSSVAKSSSLAASSSAASSAASSSIAGNSTTTISSSTTASSGASKTGSTLSKTASKTAATTAGASGTAAPTSSAGGLSSPLAFIFLAFASIVMLN